MKALAIPVACAAFAIASAQADPPAVSSTTEFDGSTTVRALNGGAETVHVGIKSWKVVGERGGSGPRYELPLHGPYIVHLVNGELLASIDGQTTTQGSGDYWTVKQGATMQVKVLSELAILETFIVTK